MLRRRSGVRTTIAAIETDGLTKYYGEVRGVADLSFTVQDGEVFGFLEPNGAGKRTIRTLIGFQSPTAGTATVLLVVVSQLWLRRFDV